MTTNQPVDKVFEEAIRDENYDALMGLPDDLEYDDLRIGPSKLHPLDFVMDNYAGGLDEKFTSIAVAKMVTSGMTGRAKYGMPSRSPAVELLATRALPFEANYHLMKSNLRAEVEAGKDAKGFIDQVVKAVADQHKDMDYNEYCKAGPLVAFGGSSKNTLLGIVMEVVRHLDQDSEDTDLSALQEHQKTIVEPLVSFIEKRNDDLETAALAVSKTKNNKGGAPQNSLNDRSSKQSFANSSPQQEGAGQAHPDADSDVYTQTEKEEFKDVWADMNANFFGQENAKMMMRGIHMRSAFDQVRHKNPETMPKDALHTRIVGPTGVGKTTLAKYYNRILTAGGRSNGNFVHLTREKVVATHIGQTEDAMKEFLEQASGGVLFIDEVHNLTPEMGGDKRDFGFRVVEALVAVMEEQRENMTIVVAGYDEDIERFLNSDKGLRGRFDNLINLEAYDKEGLGQIMDIFAEQHELIIPDDVKDYALDEMLAYKEDVGDQFANGRVVRNFVEKLPTEMAMRMMPDGDASVLESMSHDEMNTVALEDAKVYMERLRGSVPKVPEKRGIGFHANI